MKQLARIFSIFVMAAMLATAAISTQSAHAAPPAPVTYTVTKAADTNDGVCDADCSLREAITAANANTPAADTIHFSGNFTILLGSELPAISDDLSIDGGANTIILDAQSSTYRVMTVNASTTVYLQVLTIQNGKAADGGAIENMGSLHVRYSLFKNNVVTGGGGAIDNTGTTNLDIQQSTFDGNSAGSSGGAIWSGNILNVSNSTFKDNSAGALTAGDGGAIYTEGTATLIHNTFSGNDAGNNGAGIINNTGGNLTLINNIIANTGARNTPDCGNWGTLNAASKNNLIESDSASPNNCGNASTNDILGQNPSLGTFITDINYYSGVFPLGNGSLAINAADATACSSSPVLNTDQSNGARLPNGGATCDIGSYEVWDTVSPETNIDSKTPSTTPTSSTTMDFIFSGTDSDSGVKSFECDVDGNGFAPCTSPVHLHDLLSKTYIFNVRAIDYVGNVDASPASYTWTVASPTVTLNLPEIGGTAVDFNTQAVGYTSSNVLAVLTNTSLVNLNVGTLTVSPQFVVTSNTCNGATVAPAGTCSFRVAFAPTSTGAKSGTVSIPSNAASSPSIVTMSGTGYTAPTFTDVSLTYWASGFIERLYSADVTGGCLASPLSYCPDSEVTRAQMAVFLLRGMHGWSFTPPAVGTSTGFTDVATSYWAAAWIKQLAAEGITSGCGTGIYCPDATVTRAQMAVFLLKAKYGSSYLPPAVGTSTGFTDVATSYWAAASIKQLVVEGITSGCGTGIYCPDTAVTRAQMAVFLVKTFGLP